MYIPMPISLQFQCWHSTNLLYNYIPFRALCWIYKKWEYTDRVHNSSETQWHLRRGQIPRVSWMTTRCVAPRSVCVLPRYLCKKLGLGSVLKHLCEVHLSCIHIGNMWRVIANGPNWGIEAVKLRTPRTQLKQHRDEKTRDGDTPIYGKPTLNGVCCDFRHFGPLCIPFRTMKMKSDVISAHV